MTATAPVIATWDGRQVAAIALIIALVAVAWILLDPIACSRRARRREQARRRAALTRRARQDSRDTEAWHQVTQRRSHR